MAAGILNLNNTTPEAPAAAWQASHAYAAGATIIDPASHIQLAIVAGTSGSSIPTFNDSGGTTNDPSSGGTLVWADQGVAAASISINVNWLKGAQTGTDPESGYPIFPASAQVPVATASTFGVVQPDGTSITINAGVISVASAVVPASIRGSASGTYAAGPNFTLALPGAAQAGDLAVVLITSGIGGSPGLISGWTTLYSATGSTWQGNVQSKVLTSGDISAGSVTAVQPGIFDTGNGLMMMVVFVGAPTIRETDGLNNVASVTTSGAVLSTDLGIFFGSQDSTGGVTVSPAGSSLLTPNGNGCSGIAAYEVMPGGATTVTFSSSTNTVGAVVVIEGVSTTPIFNPMTTEGDIIYGGAGGTPERLAAGTATYVFTSNGPGAAPSWQPPSGGGGGSAPGAALTPPVVSSFSWINQGTATSNTSNNQMSIFAPAASGTENLRILEYALPGSTPWTLEAAVLFGPLQAAANYDSVGIGIKDAGNNKILFFKGFLSNSGTPSMAVTEYSNASTGVANVAGPAGYGYLSSYLMWLKIHCDGTNFYFSYSPNGGTDWIQIYQQAMTAYLTAPSTAFFCVNADPANAVAASLVSWSL